MDGELWKQLASIGTPNVTVPNTDNLTTPNNSAKNDELINTNLLPEWVIYLYLGLFFIGASLNLLQGLVLLCSRKNGLTSIILQISIGDSLLIFVALLEIFSSNQSTWSYSVVTCMMFKGLETIGNILIPYLIVCLNFHIISLWNLHKFEIRKTVNRNPLGSCNDESSECLVTKNENASRNVTIDYRQRKNDVAVMFPIILVWFISLSLSIPNFVLASNKISQGKTLCVIIENHYGKILYGFVFVFSFILPCLLLIVSLVLVVFKLFKTSQKNIDNVLTKKFDEIRRLLVFCIILSLLYFTTSTSRHVLSAKISIEQLFVLNNYNFDSSNIYQSMLHYSASSIRCILYLCMIPSYSEQMKNKLCFCRKTKT